MSDIAAEGSVKPQGVKGNKPKPALPKDEGSRRPNAETGGVSEPGPKPAKPIKPAKQNGRPGKQDGKPEEQNPAKTNDTGEAANPVARTTPTAAEIFKSPNFYIRTFKWSPATGAGGRPAPVEGQSILSQTLKSQVLNRTWNNAGDITLSAVRKMIPEMTRMTSLQKFCTFSGTVIGDENIRLEEYLNMDYQSAAAGAKVPAVCVYFRSTVESRRPDAAALAAVRQAVDLQLPQVERAAARARESKELYSSVQDDVNSRWGMIEQNLDAGSLTEAQWARILRNCGVFYGWTVDSKTQRVKRAVKPAFRLRSPPVVPHTGPDVLQAEAAGSGAGQSEGKLSGEAAASGTSQNEVKEKSSDDQNHSSAANHMGGFYGPGAGYGGRFGGFMGPPFGGYGGLPGAYGPGYGQSYGGGYGQIYGGGYGQNYGGGYGQTYGGGYGNNYGAGYGPGFRNAANRGNAGFYPGVQTYATMALPSSRHHIRSIEDEASRSSREPPREPSRSSAIAPQGDDHIDDFTLRSSDNESLVKDGALEEADHKSNTDSSEGAATKSSLVLLAEAPGASPGPQVYEDGQMDPVRGGLAGNPEDTSMSIADRAGRLQNEAERELDAAKAEADRLAAEHAKAAKLREEELKKAETKRKDEQEKADALRRDQAQSKADAERGIVRDAHALLADAPIIVSNKLADAFPNYRVNDDSKIDITVCKHELMESFAKNDFSSQATEAAISGGYGGITAGVSGGYASSNSKTSSDSSAKRSQVMVASYRFPRCDIMLYPVDLEPTPEFAELLEKIRKDKLIQDLRRLQAEYGQLFCQNLTLGGRLMSTKAMTATETDTSQLQEEKFKASVGVQVNTPYGGASVKHESTGGTSTDSGKTVNDSNEHNVFEAVGGDTILANNPMEWSTSVGNWQNWRVIERDGLCRMMDMLVQMPGYAEVPGWFVQVQPALQNYVRLNLEHAVVARLKVIKPTANLSLINKGQVSYYLAHGETDIVTPRANGISVENISERVDLPRGNVLFNPSSWRAPVLQGFGDFQVGSAGAYGAQYNKEFAAVTWEIIAPFTDILTNESRVILRTRPWKDASLVLKPGDKDTTLRASHLVVFRNAQGHFMPAMSDRDEYQFWRLVVPKRSALGQVNEQGFLHSGDEIQLCWSFKDQTTGYRDYSDDVFGRRRLDRPEEVQSDVLYLKVPFPRFESLGTSTAMIMSPDALSSQQFEPLRVRGDAPGQVLCGGQDNITLGMARLGVIDWLKYPPQGEHKYVRQDLSFRFDVVQEAGAGDTADYLLRAVEQGNDDLPPQPAPPNPFDWLRNQPPPPPRVGDVVGSVMGGPAGGILGGAINFGEDILHGLEDIFSF